MKFKQAVFNTRSQYASCYSDDPFLETISINTSFLKLFDQVYPNKDYNDYAAVKARLAEHEFVDSFALQMSKDINDCFRSEFIKNIHNRSKFIPFFEM